MPVVVDDAASVAGFLSLSITCFAGCIKGFTILSDAWRFGPDACVVRCLLEVEQHRLNSWADSVGLLDDQARLPLDANDILVVRRILEALASLLSDVQQLKRQYKLDLEVTDEEITELDEPDTTLGKLLLRAKPKFYQQAARIFRSRNGPWRRLKWVVVDVDRARKLTGDITSMINHLEAFLPKSQSDALVSSCDGMMRLLVVLSKDMQDLKAIAQRDNGAVAATARCKQDGLELGVLNRSDSYDSAASTLLERSTSSLSLDARRADSPINPAIRLDAGLFKVGKATDRMVSRALARYDGQMVLVEWKTTGLAAIRNMKHRIERVAAFLNSLVHPSFHSLQCRGYFKDPTSGQYGYVFNLPSQARERHLEATKQAAPPSMQTLKGRIRDKSLRPSLNERLSWAIALTETILQLHTSGFLHKGIRSDNVLFFDNVRSPDQPHADASPLYLAGYVYARADNPLEATETPEAEFEADLYRHPYSLGSGRPSYRKTFDLFSLGCVLLELGLWSKLSTVLLQAGMPAASNATTSGHPIRRTTANKTISQHGASLLAKEQLADPQTSQHFQHLLEVAAGKSYAAVAMACLHAEAVRKVGGGEDDDMTDYTLEVQETSLAKLLAISI